ncbi:RNA polymerase-associated protein Rtf1-like, partial [Ostrinia furnacalis]|uniref:RNA polymerase-associated protein Rtf1-like n=1 Tax=Ostrinia furnacalis TaxID=93504 RepID=UPI00103E97FB
EFTDSEFTKWHAAIRDANKRAPTMDYVRSKIAEVRDALMYEFKEEDIEKIVAEKDRFRSHPTNYAMKKTQLMKERDVAQLRQVPGSVPSRDTKTYYCFIVAKLIPPQEPEKPKAKPAGDNASLYSLHDFEINIDLDLPVA